MVSLACSYVNFDLFKVWLLKLLDFELVTVYSVESLS